MQLKASFLAILSLLVLVAGCNLSLNAAAEPQPTDRLHAQARDALDRWARAVRDSGAILHEMSTQGALEALYVGLTDED